MNWNPARRALRALLAAVLATVALLAGLSLPWRAGRPASELTVTPVAAGNGPLLAGMAVRLLDLGPAPTMGGFHRWEWQAEGIRDPVGVRALVLEEPGARVALVSLEVLLIPEALDAAVRARLADLQLDALLLGATHTHSGPGGYWRSLPGELGATGPYDPAAFARLVDDVVAAVRTAWGARGPATLGVIRARLEGLARNRNGGEPETRLLVIRLARPGGEPVAELVGFSSHPTYLSGDNRAISGDWPGRLLVAGARGPRLHFQGAFGDQSTRMPLAAVAPHEAPYAAYARLLGDSIDVLGGGAGDRSPRLATATATVPLPSFSPGIVPAWLRPAVRTLLGGALPTSARVTALRLGPVLLLATPSEPVEAVGSAWRGAAGPDAELLSLVGGYVGYVETAEHFTIGDGEADRSYYGPELAARLEAALQAAVRAVDPPQR